MAKKNLFILPLFVFHTLFAVTQLKQVYFQDYDLINRIVFVFSEKPNMNISQNDKVIEISLPEAMKLQDIKNFRTSQNKVFSGIEYLTQNGIIAQIVTDTISTYKYFRYQDEQDYKLVLDIYRISQPRTMDEYEIFIRFYQRVGYQKKAVAFESKLDSLRQLPSNIILNEEKEIADPDFSDLTNSILSHSITQPHPNTAVYYLLVFYTLVLLQLIIFFKLGRTFKRKPSESSNGLGDEEIEAELTAMLYDEEWPLNTISRELWISPARVKAYLKKQGMKL
jgi:hypothetical protein